MDSQCDVVVIGGGAAGLMCALTAGRRGRRVTVLEHNERLGNKILISGGGRCNFTNLHAGPENFLSTNPHFCKSALARYTPADFLALVEKHGIAWHEKKLGQLFCDSSSRLIVEMLTAECREAGVALRTGVEVRAVSKPARFQITTSLGLLEADSLIIATGGLSFPKLGATNFGARIATQFGLKLVEQRPGLVPLTLGEANEFAAISGVSIDCAVRAGAAVFRENLLFTHRGLSGPAILQISSFWKPGEPLEIDLLPDHPAFLQSRADDPKALATALGEVLPKRFVQIWLTDGHRAINRCPPAVLAGIENRLHQWWIKPVATEGYAKAEVTTGGVDTTCLSSKTMEARAVPGLYFVGETVDVTGWLGGYNFQWAWASGHAAGQHA